MSSRNSNFQQSEMIKEGIVQDAINGLLAKTFH
jgi:hypothetical protein